MDDLIQEILKDLKICENGPWMIPEPTRIPSGSEEGEALVIGVGGSTLRLRHVTISKASSDSVNVLTVPITDEIKCSETDLFDWFAEQLSPALEDWAAEHKRMPRIAVSWSFPLLHGKIQSMGKSFSRAYDGQDVLGLFNKALPEKYQVCSLTHDGTSSLVAGIHSSSDCVMALTLGTGVNINLKHGNDLLVNTETSFLGRPDTTPHVTLTRTKLCDITDERAEFQPFETLVGGMYIGEMVSKAAGEKVSTPEVWEILKMRKHPHYPVASFVVIRAAGLVAAAICALTLFSNPAGPAGIVKVVYTGGVVFEEEFLLRLKACLKELSPGLGFDVELLPQEFGSEVGSAIAALTEA